jgi:hypothetical protein
MSELLDKNNGLTTLLAGIAIVLCLHLLLKIGEVVMESIKKKGEHTDQNRVDIIKLEYHFKELNGKLDRLLKIDTDVRRAFTGVRLLAGEKWPEIRKEIMHDDLGNRRE